MNEDQINTEISKLTADQKLRLLIKYGHELTIMSREAYEFQSIKVKFPLLLREANEIHHRVYQAINELIKGENNGFSISGISSWISATEKSAETRHASVNAFNRAFKKEFMATELTVEK